MNLESLFQQLRSVQADPAVSVFIPTHRTFPDNQQDAIAVKNALKTLSDRLHAQYDKRHAEAVLTQVERATADLDHNYNLDSLAIFATADQAQVERLPFVVKPRVIVDRNFATRDLVREINSAVQYYIVVVTREQGRLIEAFNDQVVQEFAADTPLQAQTFPIENNTLYSTSGADRSQAANEDNYLKEFLNRVDKSLQEVQARHRLPLIVVGDARNTALYAEVCDQPKQLIGAVTNAADLKADAATIVSDVQTVLADYRRQQAKAAQDEIGQAIGANQLVTEFSSIYRAAVEGRADTLFVRKGFVQAGKIDPDTHHVTLLASAVDQAGALDDVVDDMIDITLSHGGQVRFLDAADLPEQTAIALKKRY